MKTNVRTIRESMGISQIGLAQRCGVSHKTISEIECGCRKNIYLSTLQRLAHGLGVTVGELIDKGGKYG